MNLQTPVYILSGAVGSTVDVDRTETLRVLLARECNLPGRSVRPVEGYYAGESEPALVVPADRPETIERMAALYAQDSVLYLDANRYAWLGFFTHESQQVEQWQALGQWREVRTGERPVAYTHDPATGRTYTAA